MEPKDKAPPADAGDNVFDWGDLFDEGADPRPNDASGEQACPVAPDAQGPPNTGVFALNEGARTYVQRYDEQSSAHPPAGTRPTHTDPFAVMETRRMPVITREQLVANEQQAVLRETLSPDQRAPKRTEPSGFGTIGPPANPNAPRVPTYPPETPQGPFNDPWNTRTPVYAPVMVAAWVHESERAAAARPSVFPPPRAPTAQPPTEPAQSAPTDTATPTPDADASVSVMLVTVNPIVDAAPAPPSETPRRFDALRLLLALSLLWLLQQPRKRLAAGGLALLATLTIVIIIVQLILDWWWY